MLGWLAKKIIGSKNDREIKEVRPLGATINEREPALQKLSDAELKAHWPKWKQEHENGKSLDELLPEVFAVTREASRRVLNMRHYDVQLIGGYFLNRGRIAEMKTGEGETLVATTPAVLNTIAGKA